MLFAYIYVPHRMEKMQEFIDFIFYEVWCKASASNSFSLSLFKANAELHEVMTAFYYSDAKGADFFYGRVEHIYSLFSTLPAAQINQFQCWYQGNNDLEKVCANDLTAQIVRHADIATLHKILGEQLASFYKGLYSPSLLNLAALRDKIGDIDDHYKSFMQINKAGKCPFCGVNDLLSEYHSKREAYDHYLPKAHYPFNSINFKNLVPACHHCNSNYKTSQDPAHSPKDPVGGIVRRKIFYPYTTTPCAIELQVTLLHSDIEKLTPTDISLQFGPVSLNEKIETWKDIYGIEERYKAKFCEENAGKYWLTQVFDEWQNDGKEPSEFLTTLKRQASINPYADCNFLKKSFLEACHSKGLFDSIASN
jgi:5-methylcytosine-specific restriction endonuclease McrA